MARTLWAASSCHHAPITDKAMFRKLLDALADFRPNVYVNLGDWYEGLAASRHARHPLHTWDVEKEHEEVAEQARQLNEVLGPKCKKVWLYGNHDCNLFNVHPDRIDKALLSMIQWRNHRGVSAALRGWKVVETYTFDTHYRLGPVTFLHGAAHSASAGKDIAYQVGTPFGLTVFGHTHRPTAVTQCIERKSPLPYWWCNAGSIADFSQMHYMDRMSKALWGAAVVLGDCAGADQRRTAYASKQWDAEVRFL